MAKGKIPFPVEKLPKARKVMPGPGSNAGGMLLKRLGQMRQMQKYKQSSGFGKLMDEQEKPY